eukprot:COSAG05_NODE_1113_length_5854_cov_33.672980_3_plen_94_part_00
MSQLRTRSRAPTIKLPMPTFRPPTAAPHWAAWGSSIYYESRAGSCGTPVDVPAVSDSALINMCSQLQCDMAIVEDIVLVAPDPVSYIIIISTI